MRTERRDWDRFWDLKSSVWLSHVSANKKRMMRLLSRLLTPGMRVLDAGCGSGFFSRYFKRAGCSVYSLDYSAQALDIARKVTEGQSDAYLQKNLLDRRFAEEFHEHFDVVFTDGLFEHFTEPEQKAIMANLRASLKPQGIIVTFVPHRCSWWPIIRPLIMPGIKEEPFSMPQLIGLHEGFAKIRTGGLGVFPFPCFLDGLLGPWMGMLIYFIGRKTVNQS